MVAAVVPPVVGGLLGAVTSNVAAAVIKLIGKSYDLWSDFDNDIESIRINLRMIAGAEEDQLVMSIHMEEMLDLAREVEDFLDRIQRYVVERDSSLLHASLGFSRKYVFEAKAKELKNRLNNAYQRTRDNKVNTGSQPSASATPSANTYKTKIGPVGIDESKQEIHEWVMKGVECQQGHLSIISIVGFSGSGKTTLAKAVYDSADVASRFPHRAWVVASEHGGNIKGLLTDLFQNLGQRCQISDSGDVEQLKAKISNYLKNKRYLVVLDDINNQTWWDRIKSAFPEEATSRIIVTTTIQTVARVCSRGDGYVHNMAPLDHKHSIELIKAIFNRHSPGLERISLLSIMNKCEGHPLALVTVSNYLQSKGVITERVCEQLSQNLGFCIATEDAFEELQKHLVDNYRSLPKTFPDIKACLLYLGVFPNGSNIRGTRLVRRWLAEGYVQKDFARSALVTADDNLNQLVDRSVIWPIDSSKNGKVKTCRAHGIFHEFLLQVSKSAKFITSFEDPERRHYRHLFIHNTLSGMSSKVNRHPTGPVIGGMSGDNKEELLCAHSLTICGSAGEAVGYFAKCQLLRVLDLEECIDLEDKHLDGIHKLWHLKYLSVGNTISRLPQNIEKLYCLETLDMRKTKNDITLPVEILKLPHILHLLGRFKLDNKQNWEKSKPEQHIPAKSNLQTLAGFVTDRNPGFQRLMLYMKQLRKVKIWTKCHNLTGEDPYLERAINNFVQDEQDAYVPVRSLSLDIGNSSGNILQSLECGCLSSLKLQGQLSGLVHFATLLLYIKQLCLSSTNDLAEYDLPQLRKLGTLEYLKLVGVSLGDLIIKSKDFPVLQHLCLVQCPGLPTIEEGALPNLISLQILNQGLDGLSGIELNWHKILQEVGLDSEVKPETKKEWENAAKQHPNSPKILFLKRVDPDETESMVKYVPTERPAPEMESPIVGRKRIIDAVQSGSCVDINSGLKQMKLSEASCSSTQLPTARDDGMPSS